MKRRFAVSLLIMTLVAMLTSCVHEHDYSEWSIMQMPTCVEDGFMSRECECGDEEIELILAMGHTGGEWIIDNDSTCTEAGSKHQVCSVCTDTIKTESIVAKGHIGDKYCEKCSVYIGNVDSENNTDVPLIDSVEELEEEVAKDIQEVVNQLNVKWQLLEMNITTYDEYVDRVEEIESFYIEINDSAKNACIRLQKYTVEYAELIMKANISNKDKYNLFDVLFDFMYEEAAEDLFDGIYDELLGDMQCVLYELVLGNSDAAPSWSEWIDIRTSEYSNWIDARTAVYSNWIDTRSDIYGFFVDIRIELFCDDTGRASEILEDYKSNVEQLS